MPVSSFPPRRLMPFAAAALIASPVFAEEATLGRPIDAASLHDGPLDLVAYYVAAGDALEVTATFAAREDAGEPMRVVMALGDGEDVTFAMPGYPQALYRFGFRAVVAESFAEIFFGNSTTLGIPCVTAGQADIAALAAAVERDPALEIAIDVAGRRLTAGPLSFPVGLPDSAHEALVEGQWDPIAELLEGAAAVDATAAKLSYLT